MKSPVMLRQASREELNQLSMNTMVETLGIEFTEVGPDFLKARMPVDHRTKQPAGILHGGASVALAETLASVGGTLLLTSGTVVGLEINANHIRACKEGFVEGVATPLHVGKTTQIWQIVITQNGKLVCQSRMTLMVLS